MTRRSPADAVDLAVALVNSWDTMSQPPELLRDVGSLRRLLAHFGHEGAAAAVRSRDLTHARALRDRLRRAFEARNEGGAVEVLNGILVESEAVPQLVQHGDEWEVYYGPSESRGAAFLAPLTAMALLEVIRDQGWERFGFCSARPCECVYVDRSRNRSRRYCSEVCANRAAQAAHRRRKRAKA
jgi:predicted RNA-binding Zn ribbon-like protein